MLLYPDPPDVRDALVTDAPVPTMYAWTALFVDPTIFVPGTNVVSPECPDTRLVILILPDLEIVVIGLSSSTNFFSILATKI